MKKLTKIVFLLLLVCCNAMVLWAQPGADPCDPLDPLAPCFDPQYAPIDSGLWLLLAAGIGFVVAKTRKKKPTN